MQLVRPLPAGPLDLIGDVHGEFDALSTLLARLGYAAGRPHPAGRKLVFLGDLVDRGPDSVGVLRLVHRLMDSGVALAILGNHEMNLLRGERKHGNGWWFGTAEPLARGAPALFPSQLLQDGGERQAFRDWMEELPIALEREDLRVVHACWNDAAICAARAADSGALHLHRASVAALEAAHSPLAAAANARREALGNRLFERHAGPPAFDETIAEWDSTWQMGNPVTVLTAGEEEPEPSKTPFWSSGKWRFVERVRWWERHAGVPVVVGHYWRRYYPTRMADDEKEGADLFGVTPPDAWLGRGAVYCLDFSVGRRYVERRAGVPERELNGVLGALRIPEWEVVFDDGRPALQLRAPAA